MSDDESFDDDYDSDSDEERYAERDGTLNEYYARQAYWQRVSDQEQERYRERRERGLPPYDVDLDDVPF
jgi:hypothetical protein